MTDVTDQARAPVSELLAQAISSHQSWKFEQAERLYRAILAREPAHADASHNLGVLLAIQLLKPQEALPYFETALNADSGNTQFWFSYIDALIRASQIDLARHILPVARAMGLQAAMANALAERLEPSLDAAPKAAVRNDREIAAEKDAASIHWPSADRYKADLGLSRRKLRKEPSAAKQVELMQLFRQRKFEQGEALAKTLLEQFPESGFLWKTLGVILQGLGRLAEAQAAERKAAEFMPMDAEIYSNLGGLLQEEGRFQESVELLQRALKLRPKYAEAFNNLGNAYQKMGQVEPAIQAYRQALALEPNFRYIYSNHLFTLNYAADLSAEEIYEAYEEYDERFGRPLKSQWRVHGNDRRLERRLKVGYVSPDFRGHAVLNFLEPLIAHHDKAAVEVFAYADLAHEDAATQRYKGYADHWVATRGMSDEALAERIRADGIDVLVDLAGHTANNRLGVFARKPAPVSVSWMGYGYTTGLKAIDYYLTDEASAPPGCEPLFAEAPWRLPGCAYAYQPNAGMGEVSPLPALQRGYVTFGTLTRAIRVNHRTIRVWSQILQRVPGSRLVVDSGSYQDAGVCEALIAKFEAHGIERGRLELGFHSPPWDVLRGMDIGLDCFPHNSGTTLFESLHMGVPYVTLAGRPSVGRLGSSILQGVGHAEWIAESEDEYVEKAVALASDLKQLEQIRASLRPQMQASVVMDEVGFVRRVEQAYRAMFETWVERSS